MSKDDAKKVASPKSCGGDIATNLARGQKRVRARYSSPGLLGRVEKSRFLRGSFLKRYKQQIRDVGSSTDDEQAANNVDAAENWTPPGPVTIKIEINNLFDVDAPPNIIDFSEACEKWYPPRDKNKPKVQRSPQEAMTVGSAVQTQDNPLSRAINSMQARLANHGILAAPSSILGKAKRNRPKGRWDDVEEYYRADEEMGDFIDDSQLEEINDRDIRRSPSPYAEERLTNSTASVQEPTNMMPNASKYFNLQGLGMETWSDASSDSEGSASQSGDEFEPARGSQTFQERFIALSQELKWVDWHRNVEENGSGVHPKIGDLVNALEECCFSIERASGELRNSDMVQAFRKLQSNLPQLVRPPSREGWWKPPRMENVPNDVRPGLNDAPLFDLMMAEEIAWPNFIWRLARLAAKDLSKTIFLKYWLEAARETQKHWMNTALGRWREAIPQEFNREARSKLAEFAEKVFLEKHPERPLMIDALMRMLSKILHGLWIHYVRLRFWGEQRKTNTLSMTHADEFRAMTKTGAAGFPVWAKLQLQSEFQLELKQRFLVLSMEAHKVSRLKTKLKKYPARQTFLRNLKNVKWCSCKYLQGTAGVVGSYYNVLLCAIHNDHAGKPKSVKVRWFDGTVEDDVAVQRLDEVYAYKVDDSVGWWDGNLWWRGKISGIHESPDKDIATFRYKVDLGSRQVTAKFENVRREQAPRPSETKHSAYPDLVAGLHVTYYSSTAGVRKTGVIIKNLGKLNYCVVQQRGSNLKERVLCKNIQAVCSVTHASGVANSTIVTVH